MVELDDLSGCSCFDDSMILWKATELWSVPAEGKGVKNSAVHSSFLQGRDVVG